MNIPASKTAHIIVIANDKVGSGTPAIAMPLAVALLLEGMRVATIDLDSQEQSLTHYIRNRRLWAAAQAVYLPIPEHHRLEAETGSSDEAFSRLITSLAERVDFIIVDTPGFDTPLSRLAHAAADTQVTPGLSKCVSSHNYFAFGLTALDPLESFAEGTRATVSHMAGRNEVLELLASLNLPLGECSRRPRQATDAWRQSSAMSLELMEILA